MDTGTHISISNNPSFCPHKREATPTLSPPWTRMSPHASRSRLQRVHLCDRIPIDWMRIHLQHLCQSPFFDPFTLPYVVNVFRKHLLKRIWFVNKHNPLYFLQVAPLFSNRLSLSLVCRSWKIKKVEFISTKMLLVRAFCVCVQQCIKTARQPLCQHRSFL